MAMKSNRAVASLLSWMLMLVLLVAQTFAVVGGPELPDPGKAGMTREQQIQLGFQAASQVYQQMPVLPDYSPETLYIRQIGQRLAATIPPQYSWPFEFHVIAQKEINAFALPGGAMFVNIGTITAADNEAELAGVMAHEMSHVYMQHSAKQAGKAELTAGLAGLAGAILGATLGGGLVGQLAQAGIQFGAQGIILKYSRTDEAQADEVGAIILYKAGYNPQALADFFQKLGSQAGQPPQFLSDHPNPGNREQAIQKEIRPWPPKTYLTSNVSFDKLRQHALTIKAYTGEEIAQGAKSGQWALLNQKNGATFKAPPGVAVSAPATVTPSQNVSAVSLQSVLPSPHLVTADLGPMKIAHPDNWEIYPPKQRGDSLTIAPPAGLATNGVGYGVIINGVSPPQGQRMTLDEVTSALVRNFQNSSSGLQPVGEPRPLEVAGLHGREVAMQSMSPFPDEGGRQQKERDWLVTLPRPDGSVLYLVFVSPEAQADRFRPTFENMLKSVQF
jgi:Zn-dependent protease with chaperone function